MANGGDKIRFALDHNFPAPVLAAFAVMMPGVELVPIMQIDPKLAELDDWELFLALHRHEESWDGLVTNDDKLLALPKEMTVLSQTNLTLVVAVGEGHVPGPPGFDPLVPREGPTQKKIPTLSGHLRPRFQKSPSVDRSDRDLLGFTG